jgi:pimeloyl-ACP methyl ester carboxylesterase
MPIYKNGDIELYYEEYGDGFPILLFAPGGMRSAISFWASGPFNPIERLAPHFRVIAMDQRNTGQSRAPITGEDGWHSYTSDHISLLDHLEIDRCHLMGGCIGGPYCMGVMHDAPGRVASAVLQQTIGLSSENRPAFYDMFDSWAQELQQAGSTVSEADWQSFRSNMYDGDFLFNVDRDFVRNCDIPMLVLMGNDLYHPEGTSREIAELSATAELVERWKEPEVVEQTVARTIEFLKSNTDP